MKYLATLLIILLFSFQTDAQTPDLRPEPDAKPRFVTIDIPISPFRKTVDISRIENKTIGLGQVMEPWESNVSYGYLRSPSFGYYSNNFIFKAGGSMTNGRDNGRSRKNRYLELGSEAGIWKGLLGFEGFVEKEKVARVITGLKFNSDFSRSSYGGKAWTGARLGSFSGNFVAVRYGKGYIETEGDQIYTVKGFGPSIPLPIYREKFHTRSLSAESRIRLTRFFLAEGKVNRNWYRRVIYSPDPLRYGANKFEDLVLNASLEAIPLSWNEMFRIVGMVTKNFQGTDRLLFRNDQPDFQVYLRIIFK